MSFCTRPIEAAKIAVSDADERDHQHRVGRVRVDARTERATMYTPAVTMVAAWISAETGVGPSIASGSQT